MSKNTGQATRQIIDLSLYKSLDADLLELWDKFHDNKSLGMFVFIALATSAMEDGTISISDLVSAGSSKQKRKGEKPTFVRLKVSPDKYPNLVALYTGLPKRSRSRAIIALIRSAYKDENTRINVGKLISQDTTVVSGQVAEEVILDSRKDTPGGKKIFTPEDQLGFPDDHGIESLMASIDIE